MLEFGEVDRWVVVTGGTRGLGREITTRVLADTDLNVISISRSLNTNMEREHGERLVQVSYDLLDTAGISAMIAEISKGRQLVGLINNAGIGGNSVLMTQHESEINNIIGCNLTAPILLSKYISRAMIRGRHGGKIINIASVVARTGYNGLATYAATKAGLIGFTKSLARELGRAKIAVSVVSPGFMETDMTSGIEDKLEVIKRRSPVNEFPALDDVVDVVMLLLTADHSRYTGAEYLIDAGNSA